MRGLHVHVGSQILDVEPFAESVAPVAALGEFPVYDLGGGLGRALHLRRRAADRRRATSTRWSAPPASTCPPRRELIIEPGRSMVAAGGRDALPRRHGQARRAHVRRGRRRDGRQPRGRAVRPALRGRRSPTGSTADGGEQVTVVGRHCESGDVLVDGVALAAPQVGDLLAVPATGAYCFTMANNYNGDPPHPGRLRRATARPGRWCAARPGRTCSPATSSAGGASRSPSASRG